MILINGNWGKVKTLEDVSRIIRENYNHELAYELDKLIPKHLDDDYYELESKLDSQSLDFKETLKEIIDGLNEELDFSAATYKDEELSYRKGIRFARKIVTKMMDRN